MMRLSLGETLPSSLSMDDVPVYMHCLDGADVFGQ